MLVHRLLQLSDTQTGHVQLVLNLPKVGVTNGIVALVVLQNFGGFKNGAAERQRLAHGYGDEGAASTTIGFGQSHADIFEVEMFKQQKQGGEQYAGHQ